MRFLICQTAYSDSEGQKQWSGEKEPDDETASSDDGACVQQEKPACVYQEQREREKAGRIESRQDFAFSVSERRSEMENRNRIQTNHTRRRGRSRRLSKRSCNDSRMIGKGKKGRCSGHDERICYVYRLHLSFSCPPNPSYSSRQKLNGMRIWNRLSVRPSLHFLTGCSPLSLSLSSLFPFTSSSTGSRSQSIGRVFALTFPSHSYQ